MPKSWCRLWNECPMDPKWLGIAGDAQARLSPPAATARRRRLLDWLRRRPPAAPPRIEPAHVLALWTHLMSVANQAGDDGSIARFAIEDWAAFFGVAKPAARAIFAELEGARHGRRRQAGGVGAAQPGARGSRVDRALAEIARRRKGRENRRDPRLSRGVGRNAVATQRNAPDLEPEFTPPAPLAPPTEAIGAGPGAPAERGKDDGEEDASRAVARAGLAVAAAEHKQRAREVFLGKVVVEAAREMPDERFAAFFEAIGQADPPRWARAERERLARKLNARPRVQRKAAARSRREPALPLPRPRAAA